MATKRKTKARAGMFEVVKDATRGWRFSVPASISGTGHRRQFFYQTSREAEAAAKKWREQRKEFGAQAHAAAPSLVEAAVSAAALLDPWGASILEAARFFVAARQRETASRPLDAAADEWLVTCEELRERTRQGYRYTVARLKDALGGAMLSTITTDALQAALAPPGTPTAAAQSHIRRGKVFWNWCCKRGWCQPDIAARLEAPKSREAAEIGILTPEEAAALLRTAEAHFPQAVASYALQLFAGIRAEELTRLEAENVTADGIELTAAVTKKGRRRHIAPSPTLAAWLARYPFTPCPNWKRVDCACRRLAGWSVASDLLDDMKRLGRIEAIPKATRGAWPQNALRHSHASYSVAAGVQLETLLFEFGHTGNANVLRAHYVGRAAKKSALEYFQIVPKPKEGEQPERIESIKIA